ncbi:Mur ligase domain-containing protein, partial [Acinetobacter baumannii]
MDALLSGLVAEMALGAPGGIEVAGLTSDSRKVGAGDVFVALSGTKADGAQFARDAVARGAVAIIAAEDANLDD